MKSTATHQFQCNRHVYTKTTQTLITTNEQNINISFAFYTHLYTTAFLPVGRQTNRLRPLSFCAVPIVFFFFRCLDCCHFFLFGFTVLIKIDFCLIKLTCLLFLVLYVWRSHLINFIYNIILIKIQIEYKNVWWIFTEAFYILTPLICINVH